MVIDVCEEVLVCLRDGMGVMLHYNTNIQWTRHGYTPKDGQLVVSTHFKKCSSNWESFHHFFGWKYRKYLKLTIQIITFLVGNLELNLHLPLAPWGPRGRSNGYTSVTRLSIASAEAPSRFRLAFRLRDLLQTSRPHQETIPWPKITGMRNQHMKTQNTTGIYTPED